MLSGARPAGPALRRVPLLEREGAAGRTSSPPAHVAGSRSSRRSTIPGEALALAHSLGEPVLVTGSLYLLADLEGAP